MKKFFIHSMGCKSNQFEGELIEQKLTEYGLEKSDNIENADYYILNSCSVTHKSDTEAMYLLRNAKNKNKNILNILTGCIAQTEKEKLLQNDFIDCILGNDDKFNITNIIDKINPRQAICITNDIMHMDMFNEQKLLDTSKTRASLKIQDGCDNRCSYCIIPFARGKSRSAKSEFIIDQINYLADKGFKEVVLTGIHIGQWGKENNLKLINLLYEIEDKTKIKRYRLGSLNPTEIDNNLLKCLAQSEKFCPHFHLSLQSACDNTLNSMNRFYRVSDYLKQIDKINSMFNLPFLGSDIIAGFAGETETDFHTTVKNLKKSGLTQIHTFPYSIRKGTKGAGFVNQNNDEVKNKRAAIIKEISAEKLNSFILKNIGTTREVLIEKHFDKHNNMLKGVTDNYLTVYIDNDDQNFKNTIQQVRLTKYSDGKIFGEIV